MTEFTDEQIEAAERDALCQDEYLTAAKAARLIRQARAERDEALARVRELEKWIIQSVSRFRDEQRIAENEQLRVAFDRNPGASADELYRAIEGQK